MPLPRTPRDRVERFVCSMPLRTPRDRVERFIRRWEATHPGRTTLWSDGTDHAAPIHLDDLRSLLAERDGVGE